MFGSLPTPAFGATNFSFSFSFSPVFGQSPSTFGVSLFGLKALHLNLTLQHQILGDLVLSNHINSMQEVYHLLLLKQLRHSVAMVYNLLKNWNQYQLRLLTKEKVMKNLDERTINQEINRLDIHIIFMVLSTTSPIIW